MTLLYEEGTAVKDRFVEGAMILTLAGFVVKIIGSVNRIVLSRLLGGEGIGIYQMAYPVFLLVLAVCSSGLPVAVSIMVAERAAREDHKGAGSIFRVTMELVFAAGIVFAVFFYFLSSHLISTGLIRDPRAYYALMALVPCVFFSGLLACFRGFFQGYQEMKAPAVSQIAEQLVRVSCMLLFAFMLLPKGLGHAAAGAAGATLPGAIAGLAVLHYFYRKKKRELAGARNAAESVEETSGTQIASRLVRLALPASCSNLLVPLTGIVDMLVIPACLGIAGFSVAASTRLFGYLTGMAQPLVMLCVIPSVSIAASLIPSAASCRALGDAAALGEKAASAFRLCLLFVLPSAFGMYVLSGEIASVLYGAKDAAVSIAALSPSIVFMGIYLVTTGMLQALGRPALPMVSMLLGIVVRVVALKALTVQPSLNIAGSAFAADLNFAFIALLNLGFLYARGIAFPWKSAFKILAASLAMALCAFAVARLLGGVSKLLALLGAVAAALVIYPLAACRMGDDIKREMLRLPVIGAALKRFGLRA